MGMREEEKVEEEEEEMFVVYTCIHGIEGFCGIGMIEMR